MITIKDLKMILLKSNYNDFEKALDDYNINEHDEFGNNILHYYMKHIKELSLDFEKIFKSVLSKGLNIDDKQSIGSFKRTCLQLSVVLNLKNVFDYLINNGADVNSTDANGTSVLSTAVINYLKNPSNYGYYISELLAHNADAKLENKDGISASSLANSISNSDVNKYFIQ